MENHSTSKAQIIQLNEGVIRDHLREMVRNKAEDTLNPMLSHGHQSNASCEIEVLGFAAPMNSV